MCMWSTHSSSSNFDWFAKYVDWLDQSSITINIRIYTNWNFAFSCELAFSLSDLLQTVCGCYKVMGRVEKNQNVIYCFFSAWWSVERKNILTLLLLSVIQYSFSLISVMLSLIVNGVSTISKLIPYCCRQISLTTQWKSILTCLTRTLAVVWQCCMRNGPTFWNVLATQRKQTPST